MEAAYTTDWFSKNISAWTRDLAALTGKPVNALEIGSWEGRSACWLLENVLTHPQSSITCIDLFDADTDEYRALASRHPGSVSTATKVEEAFDRNIAACAGRSKVIKRKGSSAEILRTLPLRSFDFIYIDGSHMASSVLTDAVLCWDLLKVGGIVIFDDYRWPCFPEQPLKTPKPAIDAFLRIFTGHYEILRRGYQIVLRKKAPGALSSENLLKTLCRRVGHAFSLLFR